MTEGEASKREMKMNDKGAMGKERMDEVKTLLEEGRSELVIDRGMDGFY